MLRIRVVSVQPAGMELFSVESQQIRYARNHTADCFVSTDHDHMVKFIFWRHENTKISTEVPQKWTSCIRIVRSILLFFFFFVFLFFFFSIHPYKYRIENKNESNTVEIFSFANFLDKFIKDIFMMCVCG